MSEVVYLGYPLSFYRARDAEETSRLEDDAIKAVQAFGYRIDADFTRLRKVVDRFYGDQQAIKKALDELEREDQEQRNPL